jgi:peptidylprolyl isomerase
MKIIKSFLIIFFMFCLSACSTNKAVINSDGGLNYDTNFSNNINNMSKEQNLNQDILKKYSQAEFETNMGNFVIEFYNDEMPITVSNFLNLANSGYYDGIKFHRVMEDFMIQGGDPLTKDDAKKVLWGTGGPGYSIPDEFVEGLSNVRGTIAMANSGANTGGSQFFINVVDNTYLDFDKQPLTSQHPVFGRVIEGMDIVDNISKVKTEGTVPVKDVVIEKINLK